MVMVAMGFYDGEYVCHLLIPFLFSSFSVPFFSLSLHSSLASSPSARYLKAGNIPEHIYMERILFADVVTCVWW